MPGDSRSSACAYIYYRVRLIYEAMRAQDEMGAAFEQVLALDIADKHIEGYTQQALGR